MGEPVSPSVAALIRRHPIWSESPPHIVTELARRARVLELYSGQSVLKAGTLANEVFLLISGRVRVFYLSKDGHREIIVKLMKAPAAFGESESILQMRRSTNVAAIATSTLLAFEARDYFDVLKSCPQASFRQFWDLGRRFGVAMSTERQANVSGLDERLATLLSSYAEHFGQQLPDESVRITHPIDLETLAEALGTAPRTLARALKELYAKKLVVRRGHDFIVPDVEKLKFYGAAEGESLAQSSSNQIWALK